MKQMKLIHKRTALWAVRQWLRRVHGMPAMDSTVQLQLFLQFLHLCFALSLLCSQTLLLRFQECFVHVLLEPAAEKNIVRMMQAKNVRKALCRVLPDLFHRERWWVLLFCTWLNWPSHFEE